MSLRSTHSVEKLEQILLVRILSGEFSDRRTLPSQAALAREYGVSRNTVGAALGRLQSRGLCASISGRGIELVPLVRALDHRLLLQLIKQGEDLVHAMQLVKQVLTVLRRTLPDLAAEASRKRSDEHLRVLEELAAGGPDGLLASLDNATMTSAQEFEVWRVLADAAGDLVAMTMLNGLRDFWTDRSVLRSAPAIGRDVIAELSSAIARCDGEAAVRAASRILEPRERFVESVCGRGLSQAPKGDCPAAAVPA